MAPFRLLDLPQEIQDNIYRKYFEDATPTLTGKTHCDWARESQEEEEEEDHQEAEYDETDEEHRENTDHVLAISGVPNLTIDLVSKKVNKDARKARERAMSKTLLVTGLYCCHGQDMDRLGLGEEYTWVRKHFDSIIYGEYSVKPAVQWAAFGSAFPNLRYIEIRCLSGLGIRSIDIDTLGEYARTGIRRGHERNIGYIAEMYGLEQLVKSKPDLKAKCISRARFYLLDLALVQSVSRPSSCIGCKY